MTTPNQDPSNKPEQRLPLEAELALQSTRDALEGRPMDNLMHAQGNIGESEADQIRRLARLHSGPPTAEEIAEARRHAAKLAPLPKDEGSEQARQDLLGN